MAATPQDANDGGPSDEEMRKPLKPNPTDEQVLEVLRKSYSQHGKDGATFSIIKELESYDDKNYLVDLGGTKYLAKVHNGVESDGFVEAEQLRRSGEDSSASSVIDLQNAIFQHLSEPKYCVSTSVPIPVSNHPHPDPSAATAAATNSADQGTTPPPPPVSIHELPVTSPSHSPHKLIVRLLSWVPGVPMSSIPALPIESLADAGSYLGNLCTAMDDLTESNPDAVRAADRFHAWDGKNTIDLAQFVHCIEDESRRELVQSVLAAFGAEFGEDGGGTAKDFRTGICQGDFNDANVLVGDKGRVSGVIDFGDSTYSWRVLDISVAMAYAMVTTLGKAGRAIAASAAMLRGFNSVYPLTLSERKHLRLLIASRLACSVTLGAYSYQQNPENKYLLLHAQPAWNMLGLIWGRGKGGDMAAAIDRMYDAACAKAELGSDAIIDCSDIALPDPEIADLLISVRQNAEAGVASRPLKKQRTEANDSDDGLPVITFVTGNKKKLEEVKRILFTANGDGADASSQAQLPFTITNHKLDLPELQGDTVAIAKEKCALAAKEVGSAVITEDTSLCFCALNDLPGPYIKWFLEKCGLQGLNDMIAFTDDKSGYAQTVVAFCPGPGKDVVVFDGRTKGKIVPARGNLDFGWDPVFEPNEGNGLTYAEMTKEGKDAISHRSRAFSQLRKYFMTEQDTVKALMTSE